MEAIVLAAGYSSRAGTYKMELPLGSKTLIEKTVEGMVDICSRIIIVTGYQKERIEKIFSSREKVTLIHNKDFYSGMYSSVREGARHVKADRFFIMPGDCPLVGRELYEKLLAVKSDILIPVFNGVKGHPVLLNGYLAGEIAKDDRHSNLREFIGSRGYKLVKVDESGITVDLDTVEDYKYILNLINERSGLHDF